MKKKLAALDVKVQIGLVVLALLLAGVAGRMLLVSPKNKQAADLQAQIDSAQTQIVARQAAARNANRPQAIKVADLFRLAKAMPDREDMPGIILTISQVARAAGVKFDTIEPQAIAPAPAGSFRARKIHLVFNGDFYALSDFLYRLRSLVTVHDGRLDASGRLLTVQNVTFTLDSGSFPVISADVTVEAYVYGSGPAVGAPTPTTSTAPATTTTTTTTTTPPPPSTDTLPTGASAAGAP